MKPGRDADTLFATIYDSLISPITPQYTAVISGVFAALESVPDALKTNPYKELT